jgi:hypothetical protein
VLGLPDLGDYLFTKPDPYALLQSRYTVVKRTIHPDKLGQLSMRFPAVHARLPYRNSSLADDAFDFLSNPHPDDIVKVRNRFVMFGGTNDHPHYLHTWYPERDIRNIAEYHRLLPNANANPRPAAPGTNGNGNRNGNGTGTPGPRTGTPGPRAGTPGNGTGNMNTPRQPPGPRNQFETPHRPAQRTASGSRMNPVNLDDDDEVTPAASGGGATDIPSGGIRFGGYSGTPVHGRRLNIHSRSVSPPSNRTASSTASSHRERSPLRQPQFGRPNRPAAPSSPSPPPSPAAINDNANAGRSGSIRNQPLEAGTFASGVKVFVGWARAQLLHLQTQGIDVNAIASGGINDHRVAVTATISDSGRVCFRASAFNQSSLRELIVDNVPHPEQILQRFRLSARNSNSIKWENIVPAPAFNRLSYLEARAEVARLSLLPASQRIPNAFSPTPPNWRHA